MTQPIVSIEVTGARELRDALSAAARRLEKPRELMQSLGAVLVQRIEQRFDAKRDPEGKAWAPLAASTREQYDRQDTSLKGPRAGQVVRRGTLLERSRLMRLSLNPTAGDDYVEVGMNTVTDGAKRWNISLLHEFGTSRGMPRRGIYLADPEAGELGAGDEAALLAEIADFLDDVFGA
jgi:phage gpG-like protein